MVYTSPALQIRRIPRRHVAMRIKLPWWLTVVSAWLVIIAVTLLDVVPSQMVGMAAAKAGANGVCALSILLDIAFFLVLMLPVVTSVVMALLTYHLASSEQARSFRNVLLGGPLMLLSFWVMAGLRLLF